MSGRKNQQVQAFTRAGEGVVIGQVLRQKAVGGVVSVDFSNAPVPDRRFGADAAWVAIGDDLVRMFFAQFKGAGPSMEHLVVLRLPFQAARLFLASCEVELEPAAKGYMTRNNVAASPQVDRNSLPDQTFTLDANVIIAGFSGREACMDLYHSSPHARMALKRGSLEFRAEPVARVVLTTRLLMDLYDLLLASQDRLPEDEP